MKVAVVTKAVKMSTGGVADQTFSVGDQVNPGTAYYWPLLYTGNATATGPEYNANAEPAYAFNQVVISDVNPGLPPGGLWIQTFPNGDFTMWMEE